MNLDPRLRPGVEVTVKGLGRCRYAGAKVNDDGVVEWLNVHEARNGGMRSVVPERLRAIHRTEKLR